MKTSFSISILLFLCSFIYMKTTVTRLYSVNSLTGKRGEKSQTKNNNKNPPKPATEEIRLS